ncbi:hypothetical protein N7528_000657 [Penicillium herquei]|nr:hypothetical protein N7528_000657 [Penicillium herquei]
MYVRGLRVRGDDDEGFAGGREMTERKRTKGGKLYKTRRNAVGPLKMEMHVFTVSEEQKEK